jgi:hypothetical protein
VQSAHGMRALFAEPFVEQLLTAPPDIQRRFLKQLGFLLRDLRHPSLHAKRYDEARDIYILESIRAHPK